MNRNSHLAPRDQNYCRPIVVDNSRNCSVVTIICCFLGLVITSGCTHTFGILFVELLDVFGQTEFTTSWIGSIQIALFYFSGMIVRPLMDIVGGRTLIIIGTTTSAIGFVTSSFVTNVYVLYVTFGVVTGIGNGVIFATVGVILQQAFGSWWSSGTSLAVAGSGVGVFVFSFLLRYMLDVLQWKWTLLTEGFMVLSALACVGTFRPIAAALDDVDNGTIHPHQNDSASGQRKDRSYLMPPSRGSPTNAISADSRLSGPSFVLLCGATLFFSAGHQIPLVYIADRVKQSKEIDANLSAALISVMGAAGVISWLLCSLALAYRVDDIRLIPAPMLRFCFLLLAAVGSGLMSIFLVAINEYWALLVFSAVVGFLAGSWSVLRPVIVVDSIGPDLATTALNIQLICVSIGVLLSTPLAGLVLTATGGNFNFMFQLFGSVQVVAGALLVLSHYFPWPTDLDHFPAAVNTSEAPQRNDRWQPSRDRLRHHCYKYRAIIEDSSDNSSSNNNNGDMATDQVVDVIDTSGIPPIADFDQ